MNRLALLLGFSEDPSGLQACKSTLLSSSRAHSSSSADTQSLRWPIDEASSAYQPHMAQREWYLQMAGFLVLTYLAVDIPPSTHLGINDLKFLSTETAALDVPM